jgi:hypothetical protein
MIIEEDETWRLQRNCSLHYLKEVISNNNIQDINQIITFCFVTTEGGNDVSYMEHHTLFDIVGTSSLEVCRYLLECGADPSDKWQDIDRPEIFAGISLPNICKSFTTKTEDILRKALQYDKDIDLNAVDSGGCTAFMNCITNPKLHNSLPYILLDYSIQKAHPISWNVANKEGNTALHLAVNLGLADLVYIIMRDINVDINVKNKVCIQNCIM